MTATEHDHPLDETPDDDGAWPRLTDAQVTRLARAGDRRGFEAGEVLFDVGDIVSELIVILDGRVAIAAGERVLSVHGPRRFLGELGLLTGQASFVTASAIERGRAARGADRPPARRRGARRRRWVTSSCARSSSGAGT